MLKRILFFTLLIVVFAGSSLGTFYGFRYWKSIVPAQNQFDGHAYFISGGQLNDINVQGNNDELQIELQHVSAPAAGKSYYAWLLSSNNPNSFTAMRLGGALPFNQGNVQFLYPGTPHHANLIGIGSSLLITQEQANTTPVHPTTNRSMWSYYGELPQKAAQDKQQLTALDSLRALLYEDQSIGKLGIHGGLSIQLLKNTGKILEWIYSARGSNSPDFIHRAMIRTLVYLDGQANVQLDTPPGSLSLIGNLSAPVPLLDRLPNQAQASYLDLAGTQLTYLQAAPGITPTTRSLAQQTKLAISGNIQSLFAQIRQVAAAAVNMPTAQLLQPTGQALLDEMVALSNAAFVGQLNPATNELQPGVVQIFYTIQHMATYNLTPLSAAAQK
jgi:hypothetical protein